MAQFSNVKVAATYHDEEVRVWHWNLQRGLKKREREEIRWSQNEDFDDLCHYGDDSEEDIRKNDRITVNKIGSWCNSKMAAICFKNPAFVVRPVRQRDYNPIPIQGVDQATGQMTQMMVPRYRVVENAMNFIIGQPNFGIADTGRRICKSGLLSYGAGKVGYSNDFADVPMDKKVKQEAEVGPDGKPDFSSFELDPRTGLPIKDKDGNWIPKGLRPTREFWFVDHVPAWNMVIDPDGGNDFYKHGWVAEEIIRPLDEVKKDRLYKNTKDLAANAYLLEDPNSDQPQASVDGPGYLDDAIMDRCKMVRLFEIYDFKTNRLLVVADGYGKFLRNDSIPSGIYHDPYVFFRPYEKSSRRGEFYPRPPASDIVPINREINADRTIMLRAERWDAVQRYIRYKNTGGSISDTELEKFLGPDGVVVIDADGDPAGMTPLRLLEKQQVSGSLFSYSDLRSRDFDEIGGQSGEMRGIATAKTATQADIMQSGGTAREDYMRNQLAQTFRHIGKKLLDSMQKNMTIDMAVAIEGQDGQLFMGTVSPNDIEGDYDVSVDVTEMMPRNSNVERAQFIDFLNIRSQDPSITAHPVLAEAILDMWQIRNQGVRDALVEISQAAMQARMGPPPGMPGSGQAPPTGVQTPESAAEQMAVEGGKTGPMRG